jgi:hypothetical protein
MHPLASDEHPRIRRALLFRRQFASTLVAEGSQPLSLQDLIFDRSLGSSELRRSLEVAGATSTATSLWPVPGEQTAELMKVFYAGLAAGMPKSRALQAAKVAPHSEGYPAYAWAGFLLAGSDSPLKT